MRKFKVENLRVLYVYFNILYLGIEKGLDFYKSKFY